MVFQMNFAPKNPTLSLNPFQSGLRDCVRNFGDKNAGIGQSILQNTRHSHSRGNKKLKSN